MARLLNQGHKIPLNFTAGTILVLKPTPGEKSGPDNSLDLPFDLKLSNKAGDILLDISFSTTQTTFKDYALRSLGDGRGKEQTVNFNRLYGDTVSIHYYLTDSKSGRYQILLNGRTVCHFDKCLPGLATQISYNEVGYITDNGYHHLGPSYWKASIYQICNLLPEDRLALVSER